MFALLLIASCASPSATPVTAPTPSGGINVEEASLNAIGCEALPLVAPNGDPVDITGTSAHPFAEAWDIRQLGDCVFMVAFENEGTPDSEVVFHWSCDGTLEADFRALGRCVQMGRGGAFMSFEPMRLDILFDDQGQVQLRFVPADCLRGETAPHCLSDNPLLTQTGPGREPVPSPSG